jgi:hypothetical protein
MAKEFYTERDIEDMAQRGERSIIVHDDVVLTDLAYEKARRLGVELIQQDDAPPAAPVRPYINQVKTKISTPVPTRPAMSSSKLEMIRANVKAAVRAKMGGQVDEALLDRVIDRVAAELGLK